MTPGPDYRDLTGPRSSKTLAQTAIAALFSLLALSACTARQWNQPIATADASQTYQLSERHPQKNAKDVFVILAFSGGGMRSAAFSYGTLKALRDIDVTIHGEKRSLLDEVDVISSVSGGSYTAA